MNTHTHTHASSRARIHKYTQKYFNTLYSLGIVIVPGGKGGGVVGGRGAALDKTSSRGFSLATLVPESVLGQLTLIGSSISLHSEACNALGASDRVIVESSIREGTGGDGRGRKGTGEDEKGRERAGKNGRRGEWTGEGREFVESSSRRFGRG